ncbi:MAG: ABC transporter permease, partial [bacterium]
KFTDHFSRFVAITGYSMPTFVLGLLLLMVFNGALGWFPPGRYSLETDILIHSETFRHWTGFLLLDSILNGRLGIFLDLIRHLILPAATLCCASVALLIRITRSSMLEELGKDYIRTARAKGLDEKQVINVHARRNALLPVITLASLQFVRLLSGVIITETVFYFPGIGRWGVMAAQQLDIPGLLGFSLITAVLFVAGNAASDLFYAVADTRMRLE